MDSCRNHYLCCFYFFFSLILLPLLADIISYNYSYAKETIVKRNKNSKRNTSEQANGY